MAELGTVLRSEIKQELDGDGETLVLQVELSGSDDIQNCEMYRAPGDDSRPVKGTRVIVESIGQASKVALAAVDSVPVPLEEGERELYSIDANGVRLATYRLKADGSHVFNAGSRDAARKNDAIASIFADDSVFWNWIAAVGSLVAGLGVAVPIPTTLAGSITDGTSEVKLP